MSLPLSPWWLVAALLAFCAIAGTGNAILNRTYVFRDGIIHGVVGQMGSGKSLFMVQRVVIPYCRALAKKRHYDSSTGRPVRRIICNFRIDPVKAGFVKKNGEPIEILYVIPSEKESIFGAIRRLSYEIGAVEGPWELPSETPGVPGPLIQPNRDNEPPAEYRDALADPDTADGWKPREPILNGMVAIDEMHLYTPSEKMAMDADARYVTSMIRKLNSELHWVSQHEMKVHKRLRDDSELIWRAGKLQGPLTWLVGSKWFMAQAFYSADIRRPSARSLDRRIYRFTPRVSKVYDSFSLLMPDPGRPATRANRALTVVPPSRPEEREVS